MLYSEYVVAVFLLFYSVTEVESKPGSDRADLSRQAIREILPVVDVGCIRWSATVSKNKTPQVRPLSHSQELVSLLSAGSKTKGRRRCGVSSDGCLRMQLRPALALHTAFGHSPSSHPPPLSHYTILPGHPHRTSLSHPTVPLPPPWAGHDVSQPSVEASESAVHASLIMHLTIAFACLCSPTHTRKLQTTRNAKDRLAVDDPPVAVPPPRQDSTATSTSGLVSKSCCW